ncbi:MAG: toxic anion resistance protein [Candidatus Dormibacteria bacterium]
MTDATPPSGAAPAEPAASTALILTPPAPVTAVATTQAEEAVPVDPQAAQRIDGMVSGYVDRVVHLDVHDSAYATSVHDVDTMGASEITASSEVSNHLLDRPVRAMGTGIFDNHSPVAKGLVDLRHTVEDLDPAKNDLSHGGARKLLGMIPFGDRLRSYFDKYKSAQSHINGIIGSLRDGEDELVKDNADIDQEKQNLWSDMQSLRQYAYMANKLDSALSTRIAEIQTTDAAKAKALQNDVLFAVRQKHQDLLTQLAVSEQGYLALGLIRQNNTELIKGVERATTTTVAALRTAVITAQALTNERLVLDQITAVNTVTSNMIESTSEMLRDQTAKINQQAASSTIDVQKLQTAFNNVFATLDAIDSFKSGALQSMQTTVGALETQVGKAQAYLDRAHQSEAAATAPSGDADGSLKLPASG